MVDYPKNRSELYWRSVTDELPQKGETVICLSKDGVHETEFISKNIWNEPYYGQDLGYSFKKVTHWIPLPENPPVS